MERPVLNKFYWGPEFWRILHTLSCCAGTGVRTRLPNEERDTWIGLLSSQGGVMPCIICANHYKHWLLQKSIIQTLRKIPMEEFGEFVRKALYEQHDAINTMNDRSTPFPYSELQANYPKMNLRPDFIVLDAMFAKALRFNKISGESVKNWKKSAINLCIMYSMP